MRSKILAALALSRKICIRTRAQFFQDLALALRTFCVPLNFALILEFSKVGNVEQTNDISAFNSFLGQFHTDISKIDCR